MTEPDRLRLDLGDRSYDIMVGTGLLDRAGDLMAPVLRQRRVFTVSDETVAGLYLSQLEESLDRAGIAHSSVILPPGEHTKSFDHLQYLIETILDGRPERGVSLVALGGGVIGDITGFAAATLLRGVGFIQIPTTLLSQVDSSVGGKTAINTRHGKNLLGSFYQPRLVLADIGTLSTLPRRELLAGYAEIVKYGLINDPAFFDWLEQNGPRIAALDEAALQRAVTTSCAAKAEIVARDERETDERALLNLGHTFGHALEAETGFGPDLLHGEAVALGIILAFDLSVRMKLCPADDAARVRRHFAAVGMRTDLAEIGGRPWKVGALIEHMHQDKKVRDGKVTFILTRGIGRAFIARDVELRMVEDLLESAVAA